LRSPFATRLVVVAGLCLSLALVALALWGIDWRATWEGVRSSDYWYVLPTLGALALAIGVRIVRWWLLFAHATRPPLRAVGNALLIGYFFNDILPARAGEVARVVALHQQAGTSRVESLGTATAERMYDVLVLVVLVLIAAPFLPEVTWFTPVLIVGAAFALVLVVTVALLGLFGEAPIRLLLRPLHWLPRVSVEWTERASAHLIRGLASLRRPKVAAAGIVLTTLSWLLMAVSAWALLVGFHLPGGFGAALLVIVATHLIEILPSLPASLGTFEAATIVALSAYGVDHSRALSYALVLHMIYLVPLLAAGYSALHRHAIHLARPSALVLRSAEENLTESEVERNG
jgi:uncharacterized protein (TIRG00374 family)